VAVVLPERRVAMAAVGGGYWQVDIPAAGPGTRYRLAVDWGDRRLEIPDPASFGQPEGPHGASAVVDLAFPWQDQAWRNRSLAEYVFYEVHVGTFTPAGTLAAAQERLGDLVALGITAVALMPVAQFPGDRNWGYDGVYPFAVQDSYGGAQALQQFVDACHRVGLAVVLDVVYNHLGPEGNYLWGLGNYFTDRYRTPWGNALNYDGPHSDGVRAYVLENALFWLREFHLDGLRLDAVHAIYDFGGKHLLQELAEQVAVFSETVGKPHYLIAESDLNDSRLLRPWSQGGYQLHAQWSDDFHHGLHALLTGERQGYYADFGRVADLAKAIEAGFVYDWRYAPHRQRFHGNWAGDLPPVQFVIASQNHDQVGNRMLGDRLGHLVGGAAQQLAAVFTLLTPGLPLLFMGEEYGETAPFLYFTSHGDPGLIEGVREGRKREFAAFHSTGEVPDPQSIETFQCSQLNWELRQQPDHQDLLDFYKKLLSLRREVLPDLTGQRPTVRFSESEKWLTVDAGGLWLAGNFHDGGAAVAPPGGQWRDGLTGEVWRGDRLLLAPWGWKILRQGSSV
ncbi:MAG TPA: malto-oligosyltrehalose trehalohydrolase, partial [Cyanobacteria bacterium UBA8156]|nr:malto-oligosyltrehalose trehalohydrolase [Cyanobacteria bacterium UBA8156]